MRLNKLLAILLTPLLLAASAAHASSVEPEAVVASFGEAPIYAEEMVFHIRDQVALVAVHFKRVHQVNLSGELWLREIGGEIPIEMLKDRAIHASRISKAVQLLAVEHEVAAELPFPGFARACERINRSRSEARAKGRILYGPLEYTPTQLYKYKLTNMRNHLRDRDLSLDYHQRESRISEAIEMKKLELPVQLDSEKLRLLIAQQVGAAAEIKDPAPR